MEKLAQIKWGRGKFSEVFQSNIINPSPLKGGQKVKVIWGASKKEYAALVECYPVENVPEPKEDETESPKHRAKRKLIPDDFVDFTETETAAKKKKERPKKKKDTTGKNGKAAKKDKKEKPKGKILEVSSPPKGQYISDSEEVSDSDDSGSDEDQPLINVISSAHQRPLQPDTTIDCHAESPPPPEISNDNFPDFEDVDLSSGREMIRAMSTLEKTNDVCLSESRSQITAELQLARTILERLECSFARQEAKLDKLLNMMAMTRSTVQQISTPAPSSNQSQSHQTVQQFSTPVPNQSLEYTTPSISARKLRSLFSHH